MRKAMYLRQIASFQLFTRNISSPAKVPVRRVVNVSEKQSGVSFRRGFCEIYEIKCWNCQKTTKRKNQFFCESCGSLQDADSKCDYFQLLSLQNNFDVNSTELTTKFRQLQNVLHPDKYSNKSAREQSNSLEWSSLVNKAYKTLSVPIERGEYILRRQGITLPQDNSVLDKEFLLEMMEKNEAVEDATSDNILDLMKTVQRDLDEAAKELETTFKKNDFEKAKFILIRMKYLKSLESNIKEKAVRLGAVK